MKIYRKKRGIAYNFSNFLKKHLWKRKNELLYGSFLRTFPNFKENFQMAFSKGYDKITCKCYGYIQKFW